MKIAYRIITPILSVGAIVIGIMLKLFHFAIGTVSEELSQLTTLLEAFNVQTKFEFSVVLKRCHRSFLHFLIKCVRLCRIKHLVCPHYRNQIFCFRKVDNVMGVAG